MEQMHVQPTDTGSGLVRNAASEEQLWSYLVQLASALRAIHSAGLACRAASLAPSKVRHDLRNGSLLNPERCCCHKSVGSSAHSGCILLPKHTWAAMGQVFAEALACPRVHCRACL